MSTVMSREIHLKSRPVGLPNRDNFQLVSVPVPEPADGQFVVRNTYMSVDPYMRGRMNEQRGYAESYQLGRAMYGASVGQIVNSRHNDFQVGEYVMSMRGWREFYVTDGDGVRKIDPGIAPIQAFLGTFGMPGWTAYKGLLDIGQPKEGETVFVSAAAGAVGSVACQIAKIKGCRVIASVGSDTKVEWLKEEVGVDAAFNYKRVDRLVYELGRHAPDGIDVYFENVGGEHLEAALTLMNNFGRIVCCGMISLYNLAEPAAAPRNLGVIVGKRLLLKGFIISDHLSELPRFYMDMGQWYRAGQITWRETVVEGLENAPDAFLGLFSGENLGKMLVKVGPDPAV